MENSSVFSQGKNKQSLFTFINALLKYYKDDTIYKISQ